MAEDYTTVNTFPKVKVFSCSSDAAKCTEIKLPSTCNVIEIGSDTQKIYWSDAGVDDGAIISDKAFIIQNNYLPIPIGTGKQRIDSLYVVGSSASASITVILREN